MNAFTRSVAQVLTGAARAFQTFPAAILSALAFAIVTMVRIQMDWPQQEAYNFVLNCLHWSFALGAIFSLAAITYAQSRYNEARAFLAANLLGAIAVAITFLALYFLGKADPAVTGARYAMVSGLAAARVSAAMFISLLGFIYFAGFPKEQSDFARSFLMTHKAFFIAAIYGGVTMAGTSGVAGAIQALLYEGMSEKVYMYLATLTGFLAFTIFAGYFPDFRRGEIDERREVAQSQPRFIEVLFEYIMVPIMLALTVVLILWAGRTIGQGMNVSFTQLAGIASSYTIGGIWLYIMVTHNQSGLARFYRKAYPMAALFILFFEAWALFIQLEKSGLKITEYSFAILWIIGLAGAMMLLFVKDRAYPAIVGVTCIMTLIAVLPIVGLNALPVTAQAGRLEKLLVSQNMLQNDQLIPAASEPDKGVRESITDAVYFLTGVQDAKLPAWFDKNLSDNNVFRNKLGFEPTWPTVDVKPGPGGYLATSLQLPAEPIDISGYRWVVAMGPAAEKERASAVIQGNRGLYRIDWTVDTNSRIPTLQISLNDQAILQQDMNDYIDRITAKYPPSAEQRQKATIEDMSIKLETPEISVLVVFNNVDINVDVQHDTINYWFSLNALYITEKSATTMPSINGN